MNDYELLYIITPRKAPADVDVVIEWVGQQVSAAGGETLKTNNWGRRRLAYPINHHLEGTYVLQHLRMPATAAVSLESALHITEDVIRHMLTRGIIDPEGAAPPEYVGERPRFAPRTAAPPVASEERPPEEPAEARAEESPDEASEAPVEAAAEAPEASTEAEAEAPTAEAAPEEPTPAATE